MKNLPRAFGSLGHAGERRWAEIGLLWYSRHAESGRAYFATPVLDLASRQGITGIEQLCTPLEELYESRKLMLATVLAGAVRVRNLLGAQAILPWRRAAPTSCSPAARARGLFPARKRGKPVVLLDHLPGFRMSERTAALAAARHLVRARIRAQGKQLVAEKGRRSSKRMAAPCSYRR